MRPEGGKAYLCLCWAGPDTLAMLVQHQERSWVIIVPDAIQGWICSLGGDEVKGAENNAA